MVVQLVPFVAAAPNSKDHNLFVRDRLRLRQAQNTFISKLRRQDRSAFVHSVIRDYHDEYAAWANPTADVFEIQPLHALILTFTDLEIVGRIQIYERERLYGSVRVKSAALDCLVQSAPGFGGPIRIQLYAVPLRVGALGEGAKCGASPGAWVKH